MPPFRPTTQGRAWHAVAGFGLLLLLVAVAQWRSWHGTRLDSLTVDEGWHIVAGVEYAREGDFRLNPEHPPLTKRWVGAWMPDTFRLRPKAPLSGKGAERDFVEETLYDDNDFRAAQRSAHAAMRALNGLFMLALGLLLWHALGPAWAAGVLGFPALEPSVGAHLPLVMTDLRVALALACAATCAGLWLWRPAWRWAIALGVAMGLALGAKHPALPGVAVLGVPCALVAVLRALRAWRGGGVEAPQRPALRGLAVSAAQLALAASLALATCRRTRTRRRPRQPAAAGQPLAGVIRRRRPAHPGAVLRGTRGHRPIAGPTRHPCAHPDVWPRPSSWASPRRPSRRSRRVPATH